MSYRKNKQTHELWLLYVKYFDLNLTKMAKHLGLNILILKSLMREEKIMTKCVCGVKPYRLPKILYKIYDQGGGR